MMRTVGRGFSFAGASGRVFWGPFGRGTVLRGLTFWLNGGAVASLTMGLRGFSTKPPNTAAAFANGFSLIEGVATVAVPLVSSELRFPLWIQMDTPYSWIGVELDPDFDTLSGVVILDASVERGSADVRYDLEGLQRPPKKRNPTGKDVTVAVPGGPDQVIVK